MIMDGVETGLMDVFEALRHTTMLFMFRCVHPTSGEMGSGPTYELNFDHDKNMRPFVSSHNLFVDFVSYLLARCIHLSYKAFEEVFTATGPFMENGMSCVLALAYLHMSLPCVLTEDFIAFFPAAFGIICEEWFDREFHKTLNEDIVGDDKTLRDAFFKHGGKTTNKPFIEDPRFEKVLDFIGQLLE